LSFARRLRGWVGSFGRHIVVPTKCRFVTFMAARSSPGPALLRFAIFELDLQSGKLRKPGIPVSLPPQPFKILAFLAGRGGELVTREEGVQGIRTRSSGASAVVVGVHSRLSSVVRPRVVVRTQIPVR